MRKFLLIIFISLVWCGSAFAEEIKMKLPIFIDGKIVERVQTVKNYQGFGHGNNPNSKCLGSYAGFSFINNYKKKDINLTNVNTKESCIPCANKETNNLCPLPLIVYKAHFEEGFKYSMYSGLELFFDLKEVNRLDNKPILLEELSIDLGNQTNLSISKKNIGSTSKCNAPDNKFSEFFKILNQSLACKDLQIGINYTAAIVKYSDISKLKFNAETKEIIIDKEYDSLNADKLLRFYSDINNTEFWNFHTSKIGKTWIDSLVELTSKEELSIFYNQ